MNHPHRLLVLDADTPWIWNHMAALPEGWVADKCGPVSAGISLRRWREARAAHHIAVPGWTRAFKLSTVLLARQVKKQINNAQPRAIVHTIPWTAGLLRRFRDIPHIYRPHDWFSGYAWDKNIVAELEGQLASECRFVAPNTEIQAADFRKLCRTPIRSIPMAVSSEFVRRLRAARPARPDDFPDGKPIVGCIGQINQGYDLELCECLADAMPETSFVFIGPIFDEGPAIRTRFDALFARANVSWLGPRPHAQLPNYLFHFDVCLNPLKVNEHNDRRSPLRLYDYLATGKPILSTNIAAAHEHIPFVEIASTTNEAVSRLQSMLSPNYAIDRVARDAYVDANTWEARAQQFISLVNEYCH